MNTTINKINIICIWKLENNVSLSMDIENCKTQFTLNATDNRVIEMKVKLIK